MHTIPSPPPASAEIIVNENFAALAAYFVYAKRAATTMGLTWGYFGGRYGGATISDGTLTLAPSTVNYVVVNKGTGALSTSVAATNWNDSNGFARVYRLTTSATAVTLIEDFRAGTGGAMFSSGGAGGGRQAVPITAGSMRPSITGGCAPLAGVASGANQPDIVSLDFDAATEEYAQFSLPMPKSWDRGTVTFMALWSHAPTTNNFSVVWGLQAVAIGNDDPIAAAFGAAQVVADTGGTAADLYASPESAAITAAGSPAIEDVVFFRVSRQVGNSADTMAVDARLHSIVVFINTTASNDA